MKRRGALIVLGAGLAAPRALLAQPRQRLRRIGCLGVRSRSTPAIPEFFEDGLTRGLRDLGYVEGRNLSIKWRFADGNYERFPNLAAELVRLGPEVIATHSTPATRALQKASAEIPIVTVVGDPVASGFARSLARPGGNITGLSVIIGDLGPKQLELLRSVMPGLQRAAVLTNPANSAHKLLVGSVLDSAKKLGVSMGQFEAQGPEEIRKSIASMAQERVQALIVMDDAFLSGQRQWIADLALKARLATAAAYRELVGAGILLSYGHNRGTDYYVRAAAFVDKILKGAKPADLPFEQPTKIHFAINMKTAKALGLTISKELQIRADEVIE